MQRGKYWGSRGHNDKCLGEKGKVRSTHRDIYLLFNNTWGKDIMDNDDKGFFNQNR